MEKYTDLHTHTIYSDGLLTPSELVKRAKEIGLSSISITDHDSITGLEEAISEGKRIDLEVIPGIELTAYDEKETEFHILGYLIDYQNEQLRENLEEFKKEREIRAEQVLANLNEIGFSVTMEEVKAFSKGVIVLPAIAQAVVANKNNQERLEKEFGTIPEVGTFIRAYLIVGKPAYVKRKSHTPQEIIGIIHRFGGLAVLAHPGWSIVSADSEGVFKFDERGDLNKLVNFGLDGVEVYAHRDQEEATRTCVEYFERAAKEKNLLLTGGSDFHGHKGLGKNLGYQDFYLKVPEQLVNILKDAKKA